MQTSFAWDDLARFKAEGRFLDGYPADVRTFFAPRDDIHALLVSLLESAQHSIVVNMFGYDDEELDAIIRSKLESPHVYVQMSLDRSQSAGKQEKRILSSWKNYLIGNSIAIGTSSEHAISHLKILIVDGVYTIKGSTNWSISGETKQDNELTLSRNAVIAAETRAVLDVNHDYMLKQMAQKRPGGGNGASPAKKPKTARAARSSGNGAAKTTARKRTTSRSTSGKTR